MSLDNNERAISFHKKIFFTSVALFLVVLVFFGIVFYWTFFPWTVMTVNTPVTVLTPEVYPGDTLVYVIDYCKYIDSPATISRRLVNSQVIALPTMTTDATRGCHKMVVATTIIPHHIPSDKYVLEVSVEYIVNPIRRETVRFVTDEFVVLSELDNI